MNVNLPENIREDVKYLQENTVKSNKRRITKKLAIQLAIKAYAHFLKTNAGE